MPWPLLSALAGLSVLVGQRADGRGAVPALAVVALTALVVLAVRSGGAAHSALGTPIQVRGRVLSQQAARTSRLRLRDPDAAGHPRPRAPSAAQAA